MNQSGFNSRCIGETLFGIPARNEQASPQCMLLHAMEVLKILRKSMGELSQVLKTKKLLAVDNALGKPSMMSCKHVKLRQTYKI